MGIYKPFKVHKANFNDFHSLQRLLSTLLANICTFTICNKYYRCSIQRKSRHGRRPKPSQIHFTSARPSPRVITQGLTSWHSTKICNLIHHSRYSLRSKPNSQSFSLSSWLLSYSEAGLSRKLPSRHCQSSMANAHQTLSIKRMLFSQRMSSFPWQSHTQKSWITET